MDFLKTTVENKYIYFETKISRNRKKPLFVVKWKQRAILLTIEGKLEGWILEGTITRASSTYLRKIICNEELFFKIAHKNVVKQRRNMTTKPWVTYVVRSLVYSRVYLLSLGESLYYLVLTKHICCVPLHLKTFIYDVPLLYI